MFLDDLMTNRCRKLSQKSELFSKEISKIGIYRQYLRRSNGETIIETNQSLINRIYYWWFNVDRTPAQFWQADGSIYSMRIIINPVEVLYNENS